jgi:RND family efflux transporter MFP subunit
VGQQRLEGLRRGIAGNAERMLSQIDDEPSAHRPSSCSRNIAKLTAGVDHRHLDRSRPGMGTTQLLTGMAGCALLAIGCQQSNEFQPPPPPAVEVQRPSVREVTTYVEFVGRGEAVETVEVRARVKGFLESVEFEPSQKVEVGQLLFRIEPEPFEAAVASAEAELAGAEAALELAKVTRDRARSAYEKGAVTDIEMAEKEAQVDAAEASVKAARARIQTAEIDLGYTEIRSPIDGRISRELVDVGNLVGSGESTLLTTVIQDNPLYVYFDIDERVVLEYLKNRPRSDRTSESNLKVLMELVDGTRYPEAGMVDFAENRINPMTGTLQIRATFPNDEGKLYAGMFGRILIPDETGEQMLVPEVALLRDLAGAYLLVADESNIVQRRDVTLGGQVDRDRIITDGLEPTDRVIVNGIQRAIPGNPVTAEEATGDAGADEAATDADKPAASPASGHDPVTE